MILSRCPSQEQAWHKGQSVPKAKEQVTTLLPQKSTKYAKPGGQRVVRMSCQRGKSNNEQGIGLMSNQQMFGS
jgi:hypothetical protein